MIDTVQARIALAQEGMELSLTFLAIRLGLKRVTIEERYKLNTRADRYKRILQEMNKNV